MQEPTQMIYQPQVSFNHVPPGIPQNITSFKELGQIRQQLGLDTPWQSYHYPQP
jgi:hypothetical protein